MVNFISYSRFEKSISKMNITRCAISITQGIAVMLLLIVGTGATSIVNNTHAQSAILGEPIFVEKGADTIQREIGPNRT